jgi:prepilin-type N-terminal cleavage/methylation domain-containing protein
MRVERQQTTDNSRRAGGVSPLIRRSGWTRGQADRIGRLTPTARRQALDSRLSTLDSRSGFTLTELMVVMVIMIIVTVMTVTAINFSMSAERSRAAARQVQSYLAGARDRAIYEKHSVGVRFLVDKDIPNSISSMIYVEESDFEPGLVEVHKPASGTSYVLNVIDRNGTTVGLDWARLRKKGMLRKGDRIQIPAGDGFEYTIQNVYLWDEDTNDPNNIIRERIDFEPEFRDESTTVTRTEDAKLLLPPIIRPNQEPMLLPRGIVIDGNGSRSKLPRSWTAIGGGRLDIMFSPRGTLTGKAATSGLIHFYVSEAADVERLNAANISSIPSDTPFGTTDDVIGDRIIVTVFPQTGAISSHPVNPTPSTNNKIAADPYYYAETGEVAGE